jgi:hypothetical protein
MSAKNALDTNSKELSFNSIFHTFFKLCDGFRIRLKEDTELLENYFLRINIYQIDKKMKIDNMQGNEYIDSFYIYDKDSNISEEIKEINNNRLYIGDAIFDKIVSKRNNFEYDDEGWTEICLNDISFDHDVFFTQVRSEGIIDNLNEMKSFIEKGSELEIDSISKLIDKIYMLLRKGGVIAESVHTEILLRNMIRDKNDIIHLPDYSKDEIEYTILSVNRGIQMSDSIITSLTFEKIKDQFRNPLTYKKTGKSLLDVLFLHR